MTNKIKNYMIDVLSAMGYGIVMMLNILTVLVLAHFVITYFNLI